MSQAPLTGVDLKGADLSEANLGNAELSYAEFNGTRLIRSDFSKAQLYETLLLKTIGLENVVHTDPTTIGTNTLILSKGKFPEAFLRGCGLSDWEIEQNKLYNPDLDNDEITQIQCKVYDLRVHQAIQISPLFISYSHADNTFVDKIETYLNKKGIRFWWDVHDMKSGRMEKQIDHAVRQYPTVLLILSEHSLKSNWVEQGVRTARELEREMEWDVLRPVALDESWKNSLWPKRVMEQVMEYNILDFSVWEDDTKFDKIFRKLIDGLELFYKA